MTQDLCTALNYVVQPLPSFMLITGVVLYVGAWYQVRLCRQLLRDIRRQSAQVDEEYQRTKELQGEVRRMLDGEED